MKVGQPIVSITQLHRNKERIFTQIRSVDINLREPLRATRCFIKQ